MAGRPRLNINYVAFVREEFNRYGYVSWSSIARALGCSRQNVFNHISDALRHGYISQEEAAQWRSSYVNAHKRTLKLSPENRRYLESLAAEHGRTVDEIVNLLVGRERVINTLRGSD